jgi:tetrahydromethanopterin S-methyltransferase subunit D
MNLSVQEIYFIMIGLVLLFGLVNIIAYFINEEAFKKTVKLSKVLLIAILFINAIIIVYNYNNSSKAAATELIKIK